MDAGQLRALLRQPEGETLEYKTRLPDRAQLAAIVAAFANTRGGAVVIGAGDRGEARGVPHPGVAADHASTWIAELVEPTPQFSTEVVSLEPDRHFVVITVEPGTQGPYIGAGRVVERVGDQLRPISHRRVTHEISSAEQAQDAVARLALTVEQLSRLVESLEARLGWRRQLPGQIAFLLIGATVGYLLALWNPLG